MSSFIPISETSNLPQAIRQINSAISNLSTKMVLAESVLASSTSDVVLPGKSTTADIEKELKALDAKADVIITAVRVQNGNITELNTTVSDLADVVSGGFTTVNTTLQTVNTSLTNLSTTCETQATTISTEITGLSEEIQALTTKIGELEEKIDALTPEPDPDPDPDPDPEPDPE